MTSWILAKYALALSGLALVIASERFQMRWLGFVGIGLIVVAFLLRFVQRRMNKNV